MSIQGCIVFQKHYNASMQKTGKIIGANGLVGQELKNLFLEKSPFKNLLFYNSQDTPLFNEQDIVFLCTPATVSRELIPKIVKKGGYAVDLSSAFRKEYPLVVPPINGDKIDIEDKIIACPNCVAAIFSMVAYPLDRAFDIQSVSLSTYQGASGAGKQGLLALDDPHSTFFPHSFQKNIFLHESARSSNGFCEEEEKIQEEIPRILQKDIPVLARSVRVPVKRAHSISAQVTFFKKPTSYKEALQKFSGIEYHSSPTPQFAENKKSVFYGSIREHPSFPYTLDLWIVADQLLRGAALNAYEMSFILTEKLSQIAHVSYLQKTTS